MRKIIVMLIVLFSYCSILAESPQSNHSNVKSIEKNILNAINTYRSQHGLEVLKLDNFVSEVARSHSAHMAARQVAFGHNEFDQRMHVIRHHLHNIYGMAENVAFTEMDPRSVTQMWLDSRGHRKNIEGHYNLTGIGLVQDRHGRYYVTQIFVQRAEA